jgi:2-phosphosulfolactate phosphatase
MLMIDCEWGLAGAQHLGSRCDALVVVDVLSFCTTVDVAVGRGAMVYPAADLAAAEALAQMAGAAVGRRRGDGGPGLSPASVATIASGTRIVIVSPNGATISTTLAGNIVFAACLRNAAAVAASLTKVAGSVGVIPAGERWPDGSLRPAFEDYIGAGAVIARLPGEKSPAAMAAAAAYEAASADLGRRLHDCPSGQELIDWGFARDVEIAAECDVSTMVPRLIEGAYRNAHATSASNG